MSSLASLLKELQDPTPVEYDPEDAFHSLDAKVEPTFDEGFDQQEEGSGVRRRNAGQVADDPKYEGKRISRSEMLYGWEGESDEGSEDSRSGDDEDIDEDMDVSGALRNGGDGSEGEEDGGITSEDSDGEVSGGLSDSDEDDEPVASTSKLPSVEDDDAMVSAHEDSPKSGDDDDDYFVDDKVGQDDAEWPPHRNAELESGGPRTAELASEHAEPRASEEPRQQDAEQAMMSQLKASAVADVEKGQAIRKQLALYNQLLSLRIRMQKVLTAINQLDVTNLKPAAETDATVEKPSAQGILLSLADEAFGLRSNLLETNDAVEAPSRKRKRDDDGMPVLEDAISEAADLDAVLHPHVIATLSKWSSKVNAASLLTKGAKSSSALQLDAGKQLQSLWAAPLERARLAARTRIRRGENAPSAMDGKDADVFDDRDFYHSLLKEVVDSSAAAVEAIPSARLPRVRKANVDRRASKGRKIRYNVHEKLVDFMVPQGENHSEWTDERRDELFAGLLGRGWDSSAPIGVLGPDLGGAMGGDEGTADVGQLRLFG